MFSVIGRPGGGAAGKQRKVSGGAVRDCKGSAGKRREVSG